MVDAVALVSCGLLIGVVAALVLTRLAVTFAVTIAALLLASGAAAYIPALRASRLDPMSVLRAG